LDVDDVSSSAANREEDAAGDLAIGEDGAVTQIEVRYFCAAEM